MATWDVKITPLNVARKEASITATRTDGADVRTFHIISAVLATLEQKRDARDQLWSMFQADEVKRGKIADFIGDLETTAETWLNAQEVL
jgi:hypothetical protein